tara:strand:- start:7 stop:237 length:231 start_codon:yes stop_codon:yes gene_type:complete
MFQKKGTIPTFLTRKVLLKNNSLVGTETLKLFQLFLKLSRSQPFFYAKQHYTYRLLFSSLNPNDLVYADLGKSFSR